MKKKAKKKAKKKIKKKTSRKKTPRKRLDPLNQLNTATPELHRKKLEIMAVVPIMPCSAITKDRFGLMFAHTQASKVFYRYSEECRLRKLVISMVDCQISEAAYDTPNGKVSCSRAVCKFRIIDVESGESEFFYGSGLGDNLVWSDNSAQTIAFKQALLMYFFTAWPQPTDYTEVIRKELESLEGEEFIKAMGSILPAKQLDVLTRAGAIQELKNYFGKSTKKGKK